MANQPNSFFIGGQVSRQLAVCCQLAYHNDSGRAMAVKLPASQRLIVALVPEKFFKLARAAVVKASQPANGWQTKLAKADDQSSG